MAQTCIPGEKVLYQVRTLFDVGFTALLTECTDNLAHQSIPPFCEICKHTEVSTTVRLMLGCRRTARESIPSQNLYV